MKYLCLVLALIAQSALAATYKSDGSETTIGNCTTALTTPSGGVQWLNDNCATHGDTITLPSGSFMWSTGVTLTKRISLIGNTTVTGDHTFINSTHTATTMTAADNTIIQDIITTGRTSPGSFILRIDVQAGTELNRVSGITWAPDPKGSKTVSDATFNGTTTITSASANFTSRDVSNKITGTGIPSSAKIASVTDSTTIVLTVATTTSGLNQSITYVQAESGTDGQVRFLTHPTGTLKAAGNIRMDHCHFNFPEWGKYIKVSGWTYGVVDHNISHTSGNMFALIWTDEMLSKEMIDNGITSTTSGHGSWNEKPMFGSGNFLFFEDNAFIGPNLTGGAGTGNFDSKDGARWVTRYNQWFGCKPNSHGTGAGPQRGVRAVMQYGDLVYYVPIWTGGELRTGSAISHDVNLYGLAPTNMQYPFRLQPDRPDGGQAGTQFPPSAGQSVWDKNAASDLSWKVDGSGASAPGDIFWEGPATINTSGGTGVYTVTAAPSPLWTTNFWSDGGYSIYNSTWQQFLNSGAPQNRSGVITSNTTNQITYLTYQANDFPQLQFRPGDNIQIRKVIRGMDEPGSGKGDLITGTTTPINSVYGYAAWPRNQEETVFTWNNTYIPTGARVDILETVWPSIPDTAKNNLGNVGFTPFVVPTEVSTYYNATKNGGNPPAAYTTDFQYPHPLTSGIEFTGDLVFGNVIIGSTAPVHTITLRNTSTTTVTISGVAYTPAAYTGSTDSFAILPGATFSVAVTFTPTTETDYNGTVTFTSDVGVYAIQATGRGVSGGSPERPYPVFRVIKKVLSKWLP